MCRRISDTYDWLKVPTFPDLPEPPVALLFSFTEPPFPYCRRVWSYAHLASPAYSWRIGIHNSQIVYALHKSQSNFYSKLLVGCYLGLLPYESWPFPQATAPPNHIIIQHLYAAHDAALDPDFILIATFDYDCNGS